MDIVPFSAHSGRQQRKPVRRQPLPRSGLLKFVASWVETAVFRRARPDAGPQKPGSVWARETSGSLATQPLEESQPVGVPIVLGEVEPLERERSGGNKLVVHFADGAILKGYSGDFQPTQSVFHLRRPTPDFPRTDETVEIWMKDLKAAFFVREFLGDRYYIERKTFPAGQQLPGRRVAVRFRDGEVVVGTAVGYDPRHPGFFVIPADPKSNNLKVFVVHAEVRNVQFL